jgi:alginate O-acetyltransferase complex protein AlgI
LSFSGFPFLFGFLPLFLCGFAIFGHLGPGWAKAWLIAASLVFYGIGAPAFLPLLVISVLGNFLLLRAMCRSDRPGRWAVIGVTLNLVVLGWFKYLAPHALTPLGLSFFTFTQIGCLLYHAGGDVVPPKALDYMLFAAFFPGLLAGPILDPRQMLSQFAKPSGWRLTAGNLSVGSGFFLVGLLKKSLLADPLATVVAAGFSNPEHLTLFRAWQSAMAYSLQLYFDFSGYTDMAIGLAWMVGLRFPDNFEQPYRAASVIAYWQRWHLSLTRFLMATIHAPLTLTILRWRRQHGYRIDAAAQRTTAGFVAMIGAPVAATMGLVSLWHGDTMPFLLFGLLHIVFLCVNHAWRLNRWPLPPPPVCVALTYLCVLLAAVFFRASTVAAAVSIVAGMVGLHGTGLLGPELHGWGAIADPPDIHTIVDILWLAALYGIVWFAPTTRQWLLANPDSAITWRPSPRWAVVLGCAATLGVLAGGGSGEFLYFQF